MSKRPARTMSSSSSDSSEDDSPLVSPAQSASVSRSKSKSKPTKRVKKEEESKEDIKPKIEDEDDEELEEEAEADLQRDRAPTAVNRDRVRLLTKEGRYEPLQKMTPWRVASVGAAAQPAAAAAAAAAASSSSSGGRPSVVYWMTREQRVQDNWCLLYAQQVAAEHDADLRVVFSLVPKFLEATERQYQFMLEGLQEVEAELRQLHIPFEVLIGYAFQTLPEYVQRHRAGAVVTCFGPLRISKDWTKKVATEMDRIRGPPLLIVDGHNVVPLWIASPKQEYAARTIRPKIMGQLKKYITEFPRVKEGTKGAVKPEPTDWKALNASLEIDRRVKPLASWTPGTRAAFEMLHGFIRSRLHHFATKRNDPCQNYISGLSPYLHFGQIAPQRCALEVSKYRGRYSESVASFIEELVVRRELSDNHCFYNEKYDSIDGASEWARESLVKHTSDARTHLYTMGEFEFGCTHDPLWNASQLQMVSEGKLHGFLRMYWCKKILEWTNTPQLALSTALYLNDRYNIDGRDPNGYVGCAWSILGIHDMGWTERPVFGKIRYMNFDGCKRKFKVADFIERYARLGSVPGSDKFKANQKLAKEKDEELEKKAGATGGAANGAVAAASAPSSAPAAASSSTRTVAESDVVHAAAGTHGAKASVGQHKRKAAGTADEDEDTIRGGSTKKIQKKLGVSKATRKQEPKVNAKKGKDKMKRKQASSESESESSSSNQSDDSEFEEE